ncbi:glycosyltransferase [Candidatus Woesearchaeota archaeon]|nr:glycosyltransferase [Candidatus Woesearchaeota archaeon]
MKVCFFGAYEKKIRGAHAGLLVKYLTRKKGVEVIECHDPIWDKLRGYEGRKFFTFWKYAQMIFYFSMHYTRIIIKYSRIKDYDVMIIGFPGFVDIYLARFFSKIKRKPLVYDLFSSIYDDFVIERRLAKKDSFIAKLMYKADSYCCKVSDIILVDTKEHRDYFSKLFKADKAKFRIIDVVIDDEFFKPKKLARKDKAFLVLFYGSFIPLHGVEYIIKAAKLLERYKDIKFEVIGTGQEYGKIRELADGLNIKNISFIKWVDYKKLADHLANADIVLGIFGHTDKSGRVVPTKVYEAMSMQKPIITGRSKAALSILKDRENVLLCGMANHKSLANSILLLKNNKRLREGIAKNGNDLFKERYAAEKIISRVKEILENALK